MILADMGPALCIYTDKVFLRIHGFKHGIYIFMQCNARHFTIGYLQFLFSTTLFSKFYSGSTLQHLKTNFRRHNDLD